MCVRTRVLTPQEDGMWMIQANAFLSRVPFVVGPSAKPRDHDSTLGAVPIRFCLASPEQDATVARIEQGR